MEVGEMYDVTWSGYGDTAVAYVSGPGVDSLRLGSGDNMDTEAVAVALQGAYNAGTQQMASDLSLAYGKLAALTAENTRLNSQVNQLTFGGPS
jgi:hypothetical protein